MPASDEQVRTAIAIEKVLCAALHRPWEPSGVFSVVTLADDAARRIAGLEAAILGAKHLLEGSDADPEAAWRLLDETYAAK